MKSYSRPDTEPYRLDYRRLRDEGYATYKTDAAQLVVTLRGCCMIDVFDIHSTRHIAYLDFDMQSEITLAHAFGSPVIGLPFTNHFRRTVGRHILPFKDLRAEHDVGLFIKKPYRNKGDKGIWNLDALLMVIAMETAWEHGVTIFTIKPTGDRARYYRRKFAAQPWPASAAELLLAIDLKAVRKKHKHIQLTEANGQTRLFNVQGTPDINPN